MVEVLVFGLLAGLDNLQISSALSLLPLRKARMHLLAAAFCASEICAAVLGLMIGRSVGQLLDGWPQYLAPAIMLGCGLLVLVLAWRSREPDLARLVNHPSLLFGLPLSLSIDNLVAGAGISFSRFPLLASALTIGLVSATMACLGLYLGQYLGRYLRRFLPEKIEVVVGVYLCFLAVRTLLNGSD